MSALPIFYGLLALVIAGGAGWLFWIDLQTDHGSPSAAVTLISAPEKPDAHSEKIPPHPAPQNAVAEEAQLKSSDHNTKQASSEHAGEENQTPEPPSHEETEQVEEAEHTKATSAPSSDHNEGATISGGNEDTAAPTALITDKQEKLASTSEDATHEPAPIEEQQTVVAPKKAQVIRDEETPKPEKEPDTKLKPRDETTPKDVAALPEIAVSLSTVPDPALTKNSDYGLLPVIGPTGRLPWRIYSRPFDDPLDRPRIAIIMSEMGMSKSATKSAIQALPGAVTLSFNPYARDIQNWIEQARAAGHEVLLQLPMEPFGYPKNDPGPHSLLTSLTDRENLKRLDWMLGRFVGYSGVTNQMGSKFTASESDITPILNVIKSRGLLFLDSRTSAKSVAGQVATTTGVPVAINNRFLDHKADRATIDSRLKDLERIARYTGTAVGIGYPYPVTLERISQWAKTLARKGFVLVPVSAAINRQEIR